MFVDYLTLVLHVPRVFITCDYQIKYFDFFLMEKVNIYAIDLIQYVIEHVDVGLYTYTYCYLNTNTDVYIDFSIIYVRVYSNHVNITLQSCLSYDSYKSCQK